MSNASAIIAREIHAMEPLEFHQTHNQESTPSCGTGSSIGIQTEEEKNTRLAVLRVHQLATIQMARNRALNNALLVASAKKARSEITVANALIQRTAHQNHAPNHIKNIRPVAQLVSSLAKIPSLKFAHCNAFKAAFAKRATSKTTMEIAFFQKIVHMVASKVQWLDQDNAFKLIQKRLFNLLFVY